MVLAHAKKFSPSKTSLDSILVPFPCILSSLFEDFFFWNSLGGN